MGVQNSLFLYRSLFSKPFPSKLLSGNLFLCPGCCSQYSCLYMFLTESHQGSHLSPRKTSRVEVKADLCVSPSDSSKHTTKKIFESLVALFGTSNMCHVCGSPPYGCQQSGKWERIGG